MDTSAYSLPRRYVAALPAVRLGPLGHWLGAFLLVLYLGMKGGGYDQLVQGEVGAVAWWGVLVCSLAGLLSTDRVSRLGWAGFLLLGGFAVWSYIGIGWSESQENGWIELAHIVTLLGLFLLALAVQGRDTSRFLMNGLTAGVVVLAGVALLSRLQPQLFPSSALAELLTPARSRLHYPLNYWNALAALVAVGLPLVWHVASDARTIVMRALAAAALPPMVLAMYFTLSRGGALAAIAGLVTFLLFAPRFVARVTTLVIAAAGSVLLVAAAAQRSALVDGLGTAAAHRQGDEMLAMVLVVCAGVAMLQTAVALWLQATKRRRSVSPGRRVLVLGLVLLVGVAGVIGGWGQISDRWEKFKNPHLGLRVGQSRTPARFQSASGNGRYQYWSAAVHAGKSSPLKGIGTGSFEFWWKRHDTLGGKIRRAHSHVFQTFAELGIVGSVLLLGLLGLILAAGVLRALRGPNRGLIAAALAGAVTFTVATSIDWVWEVTVVPTVFLVLAAVILGSGRAPRSGEARWPGLLRRAGLAVAAAIALIAISIPLAGASFIRDSRASFARGDLAAAFRDARDAERVQPYAATPKLQLALVLERAGRLGAAADAARSAIRKEPTNPALWLVLSRIDASRGSARRSVAAYRRAKRLNPRSQIFQLGSAPVR